MYKNDIMKKIDGIGAEVMKKIIKKRERPYTNGRGNIIDFLINPYFLERLLSS